MPPTASPAISNEDRTLLESYRNERAVYEDDTSNADASLPPHNTQQIQSILNGYVSAPAKSKLYNVLSAWHIDVQDLWFDFTTQYRSRRLLAELAPLASIETREAAYQLIREAYADRRGVEVPVHIRSVDHFEVEDVKEAKKAAWKRKEGHSQSNVDEDSNNQRILAATRPIKRRKVTARSSLEESERAIDGDGISAGNLTTDALRKPSSRGTGSKVEASNMSPPEARKKYRELVDTAPSHQYRKSVEPTKPSTHSVDHATHTPSTRNPAACPAELGKKGYGSLATIAEDDDVVIIEDGNNDVIVTNRDRGLTISDESSCPFSRTTDVPDDPRQKETAAFECFVGITKWLSASCINEILTLFNPNPIAWFTVDSSVIQIENGTGSDINLSGRSTVTRLFIPIHHKDQKGKGFHWSSAVIDLTERLITLDDSLPDHQRSESVKRTLYSFGAANALDLEGYRIDMEPSPRIRQKNSYDCGLVVVMRFMSIFHDLPIEEWQLGLWRPLLGSLFGTPAEITPDLSISELTLSEVVKTINVEQAVNDLDAIQDKLHAVRSRLSLYEKVAGIVERQICVLKSRDNDYINARRTREFLANVSFYGEQMKSWHQDLSAYAGAVTRQLRMASSVAGGLSFQGRLENMLRYTKRNEHLANIKHSSMKQRRETLLRKAEDQHRALGLALEERRNLVGMCSV